MEFFSKAGGKGRALNATKTIHVVDKVFPINNYEGMGMSVRELDRVAMHWIL